MQRGAIVGFDGSQPPSFVEEAGALLEEIGFDALWVPEHVLFFPDYDPQYPYSGDGRLRGNPKGVMDPFAVLTFLAATTSRIRLGTGICIVPQRHPAYPAKHVADLDRLSGGRFDFGVGVGWQREEYEALGIPFEERGRRMDEALEAMEALWTEDVATYRGEFVNLECVWSHPKPVQRPHPPIILGSATGTGRQRVVRYCDGWMPINVLLDDMPAAIADLHRRAEEAGRDPASIELSIFAQVDVNEDLLKRYRDLGIARSVIGVPTSAPDRVEGVLDRYAKLMVELES